LRQPIHKLFNLAIGLIGGVASANLNAGEALSEQRQQELVYLLRQDCGSCHGMTLKGGLGPSLLPAALAAKPAEYLHQVIAKGVPGTAMPPWDNILQAEEIDFLVDYLTRPAAAQELN
jgi:cytochrome c55X